MYPSIQKPYSGLFVVNQVKGIEELLDTNDSLAFFYLKRTFTNKFLSIFKYFKFFLAFIAFSIKKKKFEIIHVHYYYPTIYLALFYKFAFNRKVKIIVTFHGGDVYKFSKAKLYKYPLKHINLAIPVSEMLGKEIKKRYSGPIEVISAGINDLFVPSKVKSEKLFDLIFVGSFFEVKGFDLFVNALEQLNNNIRVCFVGSGSLQPLIQNLEKTNISFEIYNDIDQEKILHLLYQSKFLINTSRNESFGLSMAEAMASGTPVIATKTDGSLAQIADGGNGILIKDNQIEDIINSINIALSLNESEYNKLGAECLKSSEKYKLVYVSKQIYSLYKEIIS